MASYEEKENQSGNWYLFILKVFKSDDNILWSRPSVKTSLRIQWALMQKIRLSLKESGAQITKYCELSALKQQKFIMSQFLRTEDYLGF